jgi:hypothetical protein
MRRCESPSQAAAANGCVAILLECTGGTREAHTTARAAAHGVELALLAIVVAGGARGSAARSLKGVLAAWRAARLPDAGLELARSTFHTPMGARLCLGLTGGARNALSGAGTAAAHGFLSRRTVVIALVAAHLRTTDMEAPSSTVQALRLAPRKVILPRPTCIASVRAGTGLRESLLAWLTKAWASTAAACVLVTCTAVVVALLAGVRAAQVRECARCAALASVRSSAGGMLARCARRAPKLARGRLVLTRNTRRASARCFEPAALMLGAGRARVVARLATSVPNLVLEPAARTILALVPPNPRLNPPSRAAMATHIARARDRLASFAVCAGGLAQLVAVLPGRALCAKGRVAYIVLKAPYLTRSALPIGRGARSLALVLAWWAVL